MNASNRARTALLGLAVGAAIALPHRAPAVVTSIWVVDSYKQWNEGEGDNVLITSEGEIRPGWKTHRIELEADAVWSAARAPDGSLLLGTDDRGAIVRVRGDKVTKLAAIDGAIAIVALAVGPRGAVYAGTMPGGEVWRVDAATGKASRLADLPDAETVWALAVAPDGKTVYAGTGPDGKLFAVDAASGKATVAFESKDKRVMALAIADDGAVWLGTSDKALVFRYDPRTRTARAMADFDGNEVTALAAAPGGVVAIANEFAEPTGTGARTARAAAKGTEKEKRREAGQKPDRPKVGAAPGADKEEPTNAKLPRKGARKGKGALYRIGNDGQLEQLHALTATYFASVAVGPDGAVFAGAGDKGRIYLVDARDAVSTAFDVRERVVSHIVVDGDRIAFATADGAALYRATGAASDAVYTSDVQDTGASSRFGRIAWHATGDVVVETRTGNTADPDIGWSRWAAPKQIARAGGEARGGRIASPPGRYVQFRVKFTGDRDAVVRSARIYHVPRNRPTRIKSIRVGTETKRVVTNKDVVKPRSPIVTISWKVDNPDGDETAYTIDVRREGDVRWRRLVTKNGRPIT
ncbi:MAG: hypothetical protein D6689_22565, partial [Deltaproteobacteria bacterium]